MKTIIIILIFTFSLQNAFTQDSQLIVNLSDGSTEVFNVAEIQKITFSNIVSISDVEKLNTVLNQLKLFPNYPNPFSQQTTIKYEVFEKGSVRINVYNNNGVLVNEIFSGIQDEGTYKIIWDGTNIEKQKVPTGLYFFQVLLNNEVDSKQMIYIHK
jgi:hypothetical protein